MAEADRLELEVAGRTVSISSAQRVVFPDPGYTKGDVARYYATVSARLFAVLKDRPTTLERWPDGVQPDMELGSGGFFNKHLLRGTPQWVGSCVITFPSGRHGTELCPAEPATAVWAAHMGTITFHPWPVRAPHVDHPDQLRFDIDPQPGTTFTDAVAAAHLLAEVLEEIDMVGFVKTSGGRGLHVFVPITPQWDFVEVRHAVIALGRELSRRAPDLVTVNWWREERGAKVFIDYNQAARDRTMASAYSLRATDMATVSTPVSWRELNDVTPEQFTLATVPDRLAEADPWAELDQQRFSIETLLQWWDRDVESGESELPYPPDYPKMPGEPPRVPPSKARREDKGSS